MLKQYIPLLVIFDVNSFLCHQSLIYFLDLGRFSFWSWDDVVLLQTIHSWEDFA